MRDSKTSSRPMSNGEQLFFPGTDHRSVMSLTITNSDVAWTDKVQNPSKLILLNDTLIVVGEKVLIMDAFTGHVRKSFRVSPGGSFAINNRMEMFHVTTQGF